MAFALDGGQVPVVRFLAWFYAAVAAAVVVWTLLVDFLMRNSSTEHIAEKLFTLSDLHAFVVSELTLVGRFGGDSVLVYDQLRTLIVRQLAVRPEEVIPSARFVQDLNAD